MQKSRLFVIDLDEAQEISGLLEILEQKDWKVYTASTLHDASVRLAARAEFTCAILVTLPETLSDSALDTLGNLIQNQPETTHAEWVFLHAPLTRQQAKQLEPLEEQAYSFLERPIAEKRLARVLSRAAQSALTSARVQQTTVQQLQRYRIDAFYGESPEAKRVRTFISKLSNIPLSTLFITGETGTGKGLVARLVHHTGQRKAGPMVELNCAALPKDLLESELFGHEAGAFTSAQTRHRGLLEQADGGTLFLDEIGDMDIGLQAKLLTAIEDQSFRRIGSEKAIDVDVQVIAATSADLQTACATGNFRDDLYHRLSVFSLHLPPLRERISDLADLVPPMIVEFNHKARKRVQHVPDDVWQALMQHSWPGNVRELRNLIERCVLFSSGDTLSAQWLQLENTPTQLAPAAATLPQTQETHAGATAPPSDSLPLAQKAPLPATRPSESSSHVLLPLDGSLSLDNMNKMIIERCLKLEQCNITRAAKRLGITRQTLRYRIKKLKIETNQIDT